MVRGLFFAIAGLVCGQSLDDAVRALAAKVSSHLTPNESARVVSRNLSSMADAAKVQAAMERALRKRVRNPETVDVSLTISENIRGFMLVAQIRNDVEMVPFRMDAPKMKASVAKALIWQQEIPILDLIAMDDEMVILDATSITRYDHRERAESKALPMTLPRDPRGRLEILGESMTMHLPGSTCRGTWKPIAFTCEPGGEFASGRNTLENGGGFGRTRIGDDEVVAEVDGRVHIYDSAHKPAGALEGWGSDLVAVCGTRVLASAAGERESLAMYEVANRAPVRVSDPVDFPGPITALSPAIAIVRTTGRYEAYSLTVDCGR